MKKIVVLLVIAGLLIVSGSAYMNLTRVASEFVEVKKELRAVKDENIRLNSKNEELNDELVTYEENLELLENEVKVATNQRNTLEQQRESIAEELKSYKSLVKYEPYFNLSDNKYPTEEIRFINNFQNAIVNGKTGFVRSGNIYTKLELAKIKRITELIYYPIEANMFNSLAKTNGIKIIENNEYREEYKEYMRLMNEYYLSIDTKDMNEKEVIRTIARKVATDFSYNRNDVEIYEDSAMAIIKDKKFVCGGYADIMSILLDMARIKNSKVISSMKDSDSAHIWNKVTLSNGDEYYIDLTWADFEEANVYDETYILHESSDFHDGERYDIYELTAENLMNIADKILYIKKDDKTDE